MSEKHQYQVDIERLAGEPDSTWTEADVHDGGSPLGLHDTTLFDQDETLLGGELYDIATGEKINNSTDVEYDKEAFIIEGGDDPDDPLNDPEWFYYAKKRLEDARRKARQSKKPPR